MSGENEITATGGHYREFDITEQGLGMRQMAIAGAAGRHFSIEFTRGAIGGGRPAPGTDTYYMTGLVSPLVDVPVKESFAVERNHVMALVIHNKDFEKQDEDVIMTELGIFARLVEIDENGEKTEVSPETLYCYTYTEKYDYIPAASSGQMVYREILIDTILSKSGKFSIIYDETRVFATAKDLADVRDLAQEALEKTQEPMTPEDIDEICTVEALPPKFPDFTGDISDDDIDNIFNL